MRKRIFVPLVSAFAALLAGCAGLVQKSGEFIEGSAFEEKTLALYRSLENNGEAIIALKELKLKDGGDAVEITSGEWPGFALRGSLPDKDGNFAFTEARVLSSHVHGWNDFTLDVLGSAVFWAPGKTAGNLRIAHNVERVQISSGRIRLKSSRLSGEAALTPLRNRRERVLALTEWMRDNSAFVNPPLFAGQEEFETYWKPRLFPELLPRKERPAEYLTMNAEWIRADSVKWNTGYTAFLLPEELWELRNSGALLRDWEEALPWIYMEYSWDRIIESLDGMILHKVQ